MTITDRGTARTSRTTTTRRITFAASVALLIGSALAACSTGSSDVGPSASSTAAGTSVREKAVALNDCLRQKGYDVSDQGITDDSLTFAVPEGADPQQYMKDSEVCGKEVYGDVTADSTSEPAPLDLGPKFAKCIRDGGYEDFPDDPVEQSKYAPADRASYTDLLVKCTKEHAPAGASSIGQG